MMFCNMRKYFIATRTLFDTMSFHLETLYAWATRRAATNMTVNIRTPAKIHRCKQNIWSLEKCLLGIQKNVHP